jgi:hypothetical protein
MTSKRTTFTRDPRKPITTEVLQLFDRCLQLYADGHDDGDHESDELWAANKQLQIQAARIFGGRWSFGNPTPADPCFDGPCFIDAPANQLHIDWPQLQADRRRLIEAHAEWKNSRERNDAARDRRDQSRKSPRTRNRR